MEYMVTEDSFLGGKIRLKQPKSGFRAGTDTVLLASAIKAKPYEAVLELGVGSAVGLCCLAARVPNLELVGVEKQPEVAKIANENIENCKFNGKIIEADIFDLPKELRLRQFDHVMLNPPFFESSAHSAPNDPSKAISHIAHETLADWLDVARKRLRAKGILTIIHRASMLGEILNGLEGFGNIKILPITGGRNLEAKSVLVCASWQSRSALKILPFLMTHDFEGNATSSLQNIARDGQALADQMDW